MSDMHPHWRVFTLRFFGFLCVPALTLLLGLFHSSPVLALQGKAGICGSWNNYCRGAPAVSTPRTYQRTYRPRRTYRRRGPSRAQILRRRSNRLADRAGIQSKSGRYYEAERLLKKAIRIDPRNARAQNNLGIIYSRRGQLEKAVAYFRRGYNLYRHRIHRRNYGRALNRLGNRYYNQGNYKKARILYARSLRLMPRDSVIKSNHKNAVAALRRERKRKARLAKLKRERKQREARLARERKRLATAKRLLAKAVSRGNYKAAVKHQALVVAANKNNPKAWQDLAEYLYKSGNLEGSAKALRRAGELGGINASAAISTMYQLDAKKYADKGNYNVALKQQAVALGANRGDPKAWLTLGEYLYKSGRLTDAAKALRRAHILGAPDPEEKIFLLHQADVINRSFNLKGRKRQDLYKSLIAKYPDGRGNFTRHRLAEELLRQNKGKMAMKIYQKIIILDPEDVTARRMLTAFSKHSTAKGLTMSDLKQANGPVEKSGQNKAMKDLRTTVAHGKDALKGSATDAKHQAMKGFDTYGQRVVKVPTDVVDLRDVGIVGVNAAGNVPLDIIKQIPPAKRKQAISALNKNPYWSKLQDKRRKIVAKRAETRKKRQKLEAELAKPAVRKNQKKRAEIVAKVIQTINDDDRDRNELNKVKVDQQKIVKTISFEIVIDGDSKAKTGQPKSSGEVPQPSPPGN